MTAITADAESRPDTWGWWEKRRLVYNLALAASGWAAYLATAALHYAFGNTFWPTTTAFVGITIVLGGAFLLVMAGANVMFMLGVWTESLLRPQNVETYRKTAWRLGLAGSIALPFIFPLMNLGVLVGASGQS